MLRLLNANIEKRNKHRNHDRDASLEQFVDDVIRARRLVKRDSSDDLQHFLLVYVEKTFDRSRIHRSRDIVELDRR